MNFDEAYFMAPWCRTDAPVIGPFFLFSDLQQAILQEQQAVVVWCNGSTAVDDAAINAACSARRGGVMVFAAPWARGKRWSAVTARARLSAQPACVAALCS